MPEYVGPSFSNYLLVLGFLALLFVGLYYIKKNKHIISRTINSKKRMKVSEVTLLGQGDRALILNLDNSDLKISNDFESHHFCASLLASKSFLL